MEAAIGARVSALVQLGIITAQSNIIAAHVLR